MITGLSLALMSIRFGLPRRYDLQILGAKYQPCKSKSASRTSSSVLLNESTSCVGISDKSYGIRKQDKFFMTTFRTVVSSVAKVCSLQNITFTRHSSMSISHISISYQSHTNHAPRLPLRSHLFVDCFDFIFQ
jgi:hypothetical protein